MIRTASYKWIVCTLIFSAIQVFANNSLYHPVYQEKKFLGESLFQVQPYGETESGFIVVAKNYISKESFLYWLTVNKAMKPQRKWRSSNLFEERSSLVCATGQFTQTASELIALSNSKYYLFLNEGGQVKQIEKKNWELKPLSLAAGDFDGDGYDELAVAKIGEITAKKYNVMVQLWKYQNDSWQLLAKTGLMGNIRSIAAGDLDEDGQAELVIEEGSYNLAGNIHLLKLINEKLSKVYSLKKPLLKAAYGMKIASFPEGQRLLAATANGKIHFFAWENQSLTLIKSEVSFTCGLIDAAAVDLNGDQNPELLALGYPNRFFILKK